MEKDIPRKASALASELREMAGLFKAGAEIIGVIRRLDDMVKRGWNVDISASIMNNETYDISCHLVSSVDKKFTFSGSSLVEVIAKALVEVMSYETEEL